jgi:hypothetical protein
VYKDPKLKIEKKPFVRPSKPISFELDCSKYRGGM